MMEPFDTSIHAQPSPRRLRAWLVQIALVGVNVAAAGGLGVAAEPPSLKEIKAAIDAAQALLDDGRPSKAATALAAVTRDIEQVAAADRVPSGLRQLADRCKALKGDLELEGVDVAAISIPVVKSSRAAVPAKPMKDAAAGKTADDLFGRPPAPKPPAGQTVSFSNDVAPLLLRACGGCHVTGKKGDFQIASYAGLMQSGVVQRGQGEASRLVEVILSGDMPRGGGKVGSNEVGMLMKWIDAGAAYDGGDPTLPLASLGSGGKPPAATPQAAVTVAKLKPGEVSFAFEVAPVLQASCLTCHGGFGTEARFSMATFAKLLKGGESGSPIVPGRGAESLLVRKIKGKQIEGQRMPLNKPPLADGVIAVIERWIDEGARLDVLSADAELQNVSAAGRAQKLSHAELAAVRFDVAKKLWGRAIPEAPPQIAECGDVRIISSLPPARTEALTEVVEQAWKRVGEGLRGDSEPLIKGGLILYAFGKHYDFSDFWQLRFSTERPKGIAANAAVAGDVVYAALVVPNDGGEQPAEDSDTACIITDQMAAAAFASRGVPPWFAAGAGRALAGRIVPRAPVARGWRKQVPDALAEVGDRAEFFAGRSPAAASVVTAGGFVDAIAGPGSGRLQAMLQQLDTGVAFEPAFVGVFRGTPTQLFDGWAAKEAAASRRR